MKNLILLSIGLFLLISCKNDLKHNYSKGFYLEGNIKNVNDNRKVYLKIQESNTIIPLDSAIIKNGKFIFNGIIERPVVYGVYIDSLQGVIGLFMENDSIRIDVDTNNLSNSKITGSKLNEQYLDFIKRSNQIVSKMNVHFPIFQKARSENNVEKLNEINKKMRAINSENTQFALKYAKTHPDSYIAAFALHSVLNDDTIPKDTIANIYNNFSEYVKKGDFAIEILFYIEESNELNDIQN